MKAAVAKRPSRCLAVRAATLLCLLPAVAHVQPSYVQPLCRGGWWYRPVACRSSPAEKPNARRGKQQLRLLPPSSRVHGLRGGTIVGSLVLPAIEPEVIKSSLRAVSELLTCCGLGVLATRVGLLDTPTTRALAKCVYNVFLPAMLCTSVASTVASGAGLSLLPLPLAAWLQVALAFAIAAALFGPRSLVDSPSGRDVAALSSFGNSGVLPLIFADCLFRHQPALHARANALVAMFLLGWSPLCARRAHAPRARSHRARTRPLRLRAGALTLRAFTTSSLPPSL